MEPTGAMGVTAAGRPRRRYSLLRRQDKVVLGLMIGIPLFLDLALIWGPAIVSVLLSFTNWHGIGAITGRNLVGLQNYVDLFSGTYPFFWPAVAHNLIWLGFLMFVATPMGIFMAVLLDRELRGTRLYQTVFYLPVVLSLAVIGIIWQLQYSVDNGFIDSVLRGFGVQNPPDWFGDSSLNLWAALVATSWRHVGYIMVLYLAGLKSVDPIPARGGQGGRGERAADIPAGRLPGHAADQRGHRRDHDDRGAPGLRYRLHHQRRQERPRAAVHAHHEQQHQ